jgi:hypothetical protein
MEKKLGTLPTLRGVKVSYEVGLKSSHVWGCPCPLGYNEFDSFEENKNHRPCDGCKIEFRNIFTKSIFLFFEKFCARLVSNFSMSDNLN